MSILDAVATHWTRHHWDVSAKKRLVGYHRLRGLHSILHSTTFFQQILTSEWICYFTPRWLSTAICCREFLKQLGAVKMDKSNPLDVCQKPHSASGSLYLADAYLADLSETFPLIPFTVWESLLNQHKIFPQPLKMHPGSSGKCLWDQICLLPIAYSLALISFLRCDVLCCL